MTFWSLWWVWMIGALVLAFLEVLVPAQVFLGFAIGAAVVALALLAGLPGLASSLSTLALAFAVASLLAWILVRRLMGIRKGQVTRFDHDINED